jgi:O-antigen/teichoic acid export membrane protein
MSKQLAFNGIRWTGLAALLGNLLQLVQLIIVSKFISATDYGLMAFALTIIYFAQFFGDMGISNILIFKKGINRFSFSSLFWISLLFCWVIYLIIFLLAPFLAITFEQINLTNVIRITGLSFLFLPVQLQYIALLRKKLQFEKVAIADFTSKIFAFVSSILLAINNFGVYSLVYSTLLGMAVLTIIIYYWGSREMKIRFVFKFDIVNEFFHFGIFQTGNDILNYFNFQVDTILIGKIFGINAVGFYSFAKTIAMKPSQIINPIITQVAFPIMAQANNNVVSIKRNFLKMMGYLCTLNFLVYPFFAACASSIISLFFSVKWLPAASILAAFSLYSMVRSVLNPVGILLSSRGMVKLLFYWNLILIGCIPLIVYLTSVTGVTGVAISLSVFLMLLYLPMWKFLIFPASGVSLREFWNSLRYPMYSSIIIFIVLSGYNLLPINNYLIKLVGAGGLWLVMVYLLTRFLNKTLYGEVRELISKQWMEIKSILRNR